MRAKDGAGNWSDNARFAFNVDATKPAPPAVTPEAPHVCSAGAGGTWSADSTPTFAFSASDVAPVTAYTYEMDQAAATVPDEAAEPAGPYTSVTRADGTWWLHVRARNAAGLWSDPAHCKVLIDAGSPPAPAAQSPSHPDPGAWYATRTAEVAWSPGTGGTSPVVASSYDAPDQIVERDPDTVAEAAGSPQNFTLAGDGTWYFHVRSRNAAGTWGPSAHVRLNADITPPGQPQILGATHPAGVLVSSDRATVVWAPASDATSGVAGYSWEFNQSATTGADDDADGDALTLSATSTPLPAGQSWFHLRAVDRAGNASDDVAFGPIVVDPSGPLGLSITLPPLAEAASDQLGLEQFAPYRSVDLGTATGYVHLGTGNLVVTQDETTIPRQGLSAVVRRVYNSTDPRDPDGMGPGWRLSVTDAEGGLEGLAESVTTLDAAAPVLVANLLQATGQVLEFTDGDGTTHRFVRPGAPGTRWESPPGVNLRLREVTGGYELVRPDGVTYHVTNKGSAILPAWRVTSVSDRSGNRLTYHIDPVGPLGALRLTGITHRRGDERLVTFTYPSGRLETIVSLPGQVGDDPGTSSVEADHDWQRTTTLAYDGEGRLKTVTRNADLSAEQGKQATGFTYANGLLSTVVDGRGHTTAIAYQGAGTAARVATVTDRKNHLWSFDYGVARPEGPSTKVEDPMGASVYYTVSPRAALADGRMAGGNIVAIVDAGTDAGPVASSYAWVANRLVASTDGVGNTTSTSYNDLGLPLTITRPAPNDPARTDLAGDHPRRPVTTTLSYRYPSGFAYAGCSEPASSGPVTSAGWCQMVADLQRSVAAAGVTAQERATDYTPDDAGKVTSAARRVNPTVPTPSADRVDTFAYFARGGLCQADGPRSDVTDITRFGDATSTAAPCASADPNGGYDRTGQPLRVLDAKGMASDVVYTPYGQPARLTDREDRVTLAVYDARGNLTRLTDPVGALTTVAYDANDNRTAETPPRGAATGNDLRFQTTFAYDENDRPFKVSWPGKDAQHDRATVITDYNDDGTRSKETNAVGGKTTFQYFPNRLLKRVSAPGATGGEAALTDYRYDKAGRVVRTIGPAVDAAGNTRPEELVSYTPQGDVAERRETSSIAGQQRLSRYAYNAHGELTMTTGPRSVGQLTETMVQERNAFGEVTTTRRLSQEPNSGAGRWLETPTTYDQAGNTVATSTLTTSTTGAPELLVSTYRFDELNRMVAQVVDPTNPGHDVAFEYHPEGAQSARIDYVQTTGDAGQTCDDDGVTCTELRRVATEYYDDGTPSTRLASVPEGGTLLTCYGNGISPASGYDPDKHPTVVRTLAGTTSCGQDAALTRALGMGYDDRGLLATMTQSVRGSTGLVTRTQSFDHFADASLRSATLTRPGNPAVSTTTTYGRSAGGWTESVTDWDNKVSTIGHSPAGGVTDTSYGSGAATSVRTHAPDGMVDSLVWRAGGQVVRSHTGIVYDLGGLRTNENVEVAHVPGSTADTGGAAEYGHDLLGRLTTYTSPYTAAGEAAPPTVDYTLDDGGNIVTAETTVGTPTELVASSYIAGRLDHRTSTVTTGGVSEETTTDFRYTDLGEEAGRRVADVEVATNSYDPAGHVATSTGGTMAVDYVYDGDDHLLSRSADDETTLYFYWGTSGTLAEETDGDGDTIVRYLIDGTQTLGQQRFELLAGGGRDTAGVWAWMLDDPAGNIATRVSGAGVVLDQSAFSPYGEPEDAGHSHADGAKSSLGFQGALTDEATKKVILGPRQYDPNTARFTNPDVSVGAMADIQLGADPLTGNRYLFAAANPVAYYENGHCAFGKETTRRVVRGERNRRTMMKVADSSLAGYHYEFRDWVEPLFGEKKECDNLAAIKQAVSLIGTAASAVAAVSAGAAAACAASVLGILPCSVPAILVAGAAGSVSLTMNVAGAGISCYLDRETGTCKADLFQAGISAVLSGTGVALARPLATAVVNTLDGGISVRSYCKSYGCKP